MYTTFDWSTHVKDRQIDRQTELWRLRRIIAVPTVVRKNVFFPALSLTKTSNPSIVTIQNNTTISTRLMYAELNRSRCVQNGISADPRLYKCCMAVIMPPALKLSMIHYKQMHQNTATSNTYSVWLKVCHNDSGANAPFVFCQLNSNIVNNIISTKAFIWHFIILL